jgi:ribulose-phosphate 3-epimerase
MGYKIAPSILAADFTQLGAEVAAAEKAGADMIHIDVMDGRFVPNITMGALVVAAVRRVTALPLDVHLMIVDPADHIDAFAEAGADRITIHVEADPHLHRTLSRIRALGAQAGVALNPHTPAHALSSILPDVDLVIVMTVNPGFGGQSFLHSQLPKIAALRALIGDRDIALEIDGGVTVETAPLCRAAGADVLVAGSAVFRDGPEGYGRTIAAIRSAAEAA